MFGLNMADYLLKRGAFYHYSRRVPKCYSHIDGREYVRTATKCKDLASARLVSARLTVELDAF